MIRLFDIFFSFFGLLLCLPVLLLLVVIGWFDTRSPIFMQDRVGRYQKTFVLVKFRTMHVDTISIATHLADAKSVTLFGRLLRRTKLDELPQLWNVLRGDMSLVGPRPCLLSQKALIKERANRDVYAVRPGITGLAQIQKIDMSTPELLAETDKYMIESMNLLNYFYYIVVTIFGRGAGDRIRSK